ncbi:proteasome subunit alpha [Peterkaempfera sp. SMS 1(5)a]|uniref:proteasome subunit alpha n=1 Tax=Peterkaempfera podocarpi TaxID=3232308 RepID=UPI00366D75B8
MSTPFYVSPQQAMADRAEYARKGIARGRSVVVLTYTDGIVFVAENTSRALHKVSEIYDRIAYAAVGRYNEFENLRIGGVRYADLRGYSYDRADVTARGLANVYAQTLGTIFSSVGEKPYEVELIVAEVGRNPEDDQIYRLTPDGSVVDEHNSVVVGGNADSIGNYLGQRHRPGFTLAEALGLAVESLARDPNGGTPRTITPEQLEVAVLDRSRPQQRKFKRVLGSQLNRLLEAADGGDEEPPVAPPVAPQAGSGEEDTRPPVAPEIEKPSRSAEDEDEDESTDPPL